MVCAVTERWNAFAKIRQDLYGWIDLIALDPKWQTAWGIQCTSGSNMAARVAKIEESKEAALWSRCGNRIAVVGWRKAGARGKRKLWDARILGMDYQKSDNGEWRWVVFELQPEAL